MQKFKSLLLLSFLILLHLLLILFLRNSLPQIRFDPQSIFIADLIGKPLFLPTFSYYLSSSFNIILLWLLAKSFFKGYFVFLPSLIYAISFWPIYLVIGQTNSLITLTLLLAFSESLHRNQTQKWSFFWTGLLLGTLYYYSFLAAPLILVCLLLLWKTGWSLPLNPKKLVLIAVILYLPIILASFYNNAGIVNIFKQQVQIFNEPGLLNSINSLRGESQKKGFSDLAKVTENKYVYLSSFVILKSLKQLNLSNYFTSQEKLLGFSFTSPLYLGLIIPFLYGLYLLIRNGGKLKWVIMFLYPLTLPSLLSQSLVDIHKLILFMPVIIFIIVFGLRALSQKKMWAKSVLLLVIILVTIQLISNLFDISSREHIRLGKQIKPFQVEIGRQ